MSNHAQRRNYSRREFFIRSGLAGAGALSLPALIAACGGGSDGGSGGGGAKTLYFENWPAYIDGATEADFEAATGIAMTYKEGYNCDKGGQGITGFSHTEETKRKMSAAKKGKPSHRKGKTNIHSAESNRKRSESLKRAYAEGKRKGQDYSWMKGDKGPNSKARRALRGV